MKTRVEITGIDTSELPVLSHEKSMELLKKAQSGDKAAHDAFVTANLRLVLSIVQRFYGRKACADDLFQVGCVGLIKAMKNFRNGSKKPRAASCSANSPAWKMSASNWTSGKCASSTNRLSG